MPERCQVLYFVNHNVIFIAMDYTLSPEKNLFGIVEQVRKGALWVVDNVENYGGDKKNITLSGSSAGGICSRR